MLRTFRVSVSDRWPVKVDKWKDLGVYEARNSREIQAFLIENPQIWARYIRIEFLTHYGKEYYCPLSLVRVHGTRMLESWKDTEANNDEDEDADEEDPEDGFVPEAVAEVIHVTSTEVQAVHVTVSDQAEPTESHTPREVQKDKTPVEAHLTPLPIPASPWNKSILLEPEILVIQSKSLCMPSDAPESILTRQAAVENESSGSKTTMQVPPSPAMISTAFTDNGITSSSLAFTGPSAQQTLSENKASLASTSLTQETHESSKTTQDSSHSTTQLSSTTPVTNKPQNFTSTNKTRSTNTASGSASLPTIQESFFKAVSRRLQLLETNSTLSLKYIEDQSKMLREAFLRVEKRQLQKTTDFLENLNTTVLTELRVFRQQYDEIWQSTVISLESQREESRREILAISARLNILADEVVFQKRMSIIQSVLLLLCLGLVIFSRVSSAEPLGFSLHNRRSRMLRNATGIESPLDTGYTSREHEDYIGGASSPPDTWTSQHRRKASDEYPHSRSRSRGWGPPTPISTYSRSDNELTPPRSFDDTSTNAVAGGTTGTFSRLRRSITMKYQSSNPLLSASKEHELLRTSSFGPSLRSQNSSPASFLSVADAKERGGKDRSPSGLLSPPPSDIDSHDPMDELNLTPMGAQPEILEGRAVDVRESQSLQTPTQEDPDNQRKPLPDLPDGSPSP